MNQVTPLPTATRRARKFASERAFKDRLEFHRFAAATWAMLATSAREMLATETYSGTRQMLEAFIVRALDRAQAQYRSADAVRRRGHD